MRFEYKISNTLNPGLRDAKKRVNISLWFILNIKIESHMTSVCTAFFNCRLFQNPSDDTPPIFFSIKTSHAPNLNKELDPLAPYPPYLVVPMQKYWKCALVMLWSMHISNIAAQFRLVSKELMQNDSIFEPSCHATMVQKCCHFASTPR